MIRQGSNILVTGGAGYIGSHTALALMEEGCNVVVLDNFSNSSPESLRRVSQLAGRQPVVVRGDVRDAVVLKKIFSEHLIDSVMHFAGLKSVGESAQIPLTYYENNVTGTLQLCQVMAEAGVQELVFSSSATVYGDSAVMPVNESASVGAPINPYGRSKLMAEEILGDIARSDVSWRIAVLRYFNPVGAHRSGLIGEDPRGIPNNLLPYISQVAVGRLAALRVFGSDYPTRDGTGVRDYIHVVDLANGHLSALSALKEKPGLNIWNLGTGRGYSVLEMIKAFEHASAKSVPYELWSRRSGDISECWADASKAFSELGWKAERGLEEMVIDAWRWQSQNPDGYRVITPPV